MPSAINYRTVRDGRWTLWVLPDRWSPQLWQAVRSQLAKQKPARHPQTVRLVCRNPPAQYYLKTFLSTSPARALKDAFRQSKARRALQVSEALAAAGFCAPLAVAAGEKRKQRLLLGSFLLTAPVAGRSLVEFLRERCGDRDPSMAVSEKHAAVRLLAREIRRFHDFGFVHGDLVPTNIFVAYGEGQPLAFCFMDNDRTHRYPQSLPQLFWKRNLVQLNRMPLPGISLQDRMRFLYAYLGEKFDSQSGKSLARWLERKTRERRLACDGVESSGSFRRLMHWQA